MEAVRQIYKVQNGSITEHLPADFPTDEVEVIVLPVRYPCTTAIPLTAC